MKINSIVSIRVKLIIRILFSKEMKKKDYQLWNMIIGMFWRIFLC
jgi:hypothetical protein